MTGRVSGPTAPLWLALALLPACGGTASPTMDGAAPGPDAAQGDVPTMVLPDGRVMPVPDGGGACIPNAALIARRLACRTDSQCPCGTHCDLGVCVASCSASMACTSGQRCDSFGRCREANDMETFPAPAPGVPGRIELFQPDMVFARADVVVDLRYVAKGAAIDRARWVAPDGMQVRCDPMGAFAAECVATALAVDGVRVVSVRQTPGMPLLARPQTLVGFYGSRVVTASAVPATPQPTGGPGAWTGLWTGTLTMQAADVRQPTVTGGGFALQQMPPIRVTAAIYSPTANSRTFQLNDLNHVLTPSDTLVGTFTGAPDTTAPGLTFPSWRVFNDGGGAVFPGNAPVDVTASTTVTCTATVTGTRTINCTLQNYFLGVFNDARVPYIRYSLVLSYAGALPAGAVAPAVPTAYVSTLAPAAMREAARTPWESAVASTFEPVTNLGPAEVTQALAGLQLAALTGAAGQGRLDACQDGLTTTASVMASAVIGPLRVTTIQNITNHNTQGLPDMDIPLESQQGLSHALYHWLSRNVSNTSVGTMRLEVTPPAPVSMSATEVVLPCGFHLNNVSNIPYTNPMSTTCAQGGTVNVTTPASPADLEYWTESCNRLAAATGCTVEAPATPSAATLNVRVALQIGNSSSSGCMATPLTALALTGTATHVCRLRVARPIACAELAVCAEPTNSALRTAMVAPRLGNTLRGTSHDVACATGARGVALDLESVTRMQALEKCRQDIARADGPVPATPGTNGVGLQRVFDSQGCIDTPRLLFALGEAGNLRRGGTPTDADEMAVPSAPKRTDRLTLRLTQQWLATHSFMAHEAASAWHAAAALRGEAGVSTAPFLEEYHDTLGAWRVLLHPRFATPLLRIPSDRYRSPEYRSGYGAGVPTDTDDARRGLPVTMLQLLEGQLALTDEMIVDEGLRAPAATVARDDFGRAARSAAVMLPVAMFLADLGGVNAATNPPVWKADWTAAMDALRANLAQSLTDLNHRLDGRNPLGIEDVDLPIYYQGDNVGATNRFNAISDYLVGASDGAMSVTPVAIARADALLPNALADYNAHFARYVGTGNQGRPDIADDYGNQIAALCGLPAGISAGSVLASWPDFNAATCFIRYDDPSCRPSVTVSTATSIIDADVQINNCYREQMRLRLSTTSDRELNGILSRWAGACSVPAVLSPDCRGLFPPGTLCAACTGEGTSGLDYRGVLPLGSASLVPSHFQVSGGRLIGDPLAVTITPSMETEVRAYCQGLFPSGRLAIAGANPGARVIPAGCYRGQIGALALALQSAAIDVEIANSEAGDQGAAYDVAMHSCEILQSSAAAIAASTAAHNATMETYRIAKAAMDATAAAASAVKDCAGVEDLSSVQGGVECGAALVEGAANVVSISLQAQMDTMQANHDAEIAGMESNRDINICTNDARQYLVGVRTAALRVTAAQQAMQSALFAYTEAVLQAQSLYDEGTALSTSLDGDSTAMEVWTDNPIDTYTTALRAARRATYLSVRAVEYELQASLMARAQVLAAPRPSDLRNVLGSLRTLTATRSVGGRRPASLSTVISLRDNVLQLGDATTRSSDWNSLTPTQRLRSVLNDPRYFVTGGRRIPFNLTPVPGSTGAISFLTGGSDCAERIWSVNASILGDAWRGTPTGTGDAGTTTTAPGFVRIDLLKSNTFFSQWCTPMMSGTTVLNQVASVRPSRNLFADPEVPGMITTTAPEETLETRGRIQAYLGVDGTTLAAEMYANTGSTELAARGLYGAYALFIPTEALAVVTSGTVTRAGIDTNKINDILLRVDYVSASR